MGMGCYMQYFTRLMGKMGRRVQVSGGRSGAGNDGTAAGSEMTVTHELVCGGKTTQT